MPPIFNFIIILTVIGTGGSVISNYLSHRQKLAELKMKSLTETDHNVLAEIRELKTQMSALRDTSTQYDLSFDAALQRLENRIGSVEQRLNRVETDTVQTHRG